MDTIEASEAMAWHEYDMAALWCAERGIAGNPGDALPTNTSVRCLELINDDTDAFAERVRASAYQLSMARK